MACLSKHGEELFRIQHAGYDKAYMSDGKILINRGSGWKVWGKVKPGIDPVEHAKTRREYYANITPDRVCRAAYRDEMVKLFPSVRVRHLAALTIEMMPDDPDGCWSEFDDRMADDNISLEDWVHLCGLYRIAANEGREAKAAKAASTTTPV